MFVSDMGVLRFAPPGSVSLWNVHHNKVGMCIAAVIKHHRASSLRWTKRIQLFLAHSSRYDFAVHITDHESEFVVLIQF